VLTFFIAGLLYLLCFKHVDNLGAYSIPSDTGLLIPSVYDYNIFPRQSGPTSHERKMFASRFRRSLSSLARIALVAADALFRQEPDEEEDEGDGNNNDDDDEDDDGYSE
jgi:hypothetical protein